MDISRVRVLIVDDCADWLAGLRTFLLLVAILQIRHGGAFGCLISEYRVDQGVHHILHQTADVHHSNVWREQLDAMLAANPESADEALAAADKAAHPASLHVERAVFIDGAQKCAGVLLR